MLRNKTIVLGVTGGIAAYKAADLASKLTQLGAQVDVIMTQAATRFVAPLTFRSLTGRQVVTDMFEPVTDWNIEHVSLADAANLVIIAPATADIIARIAAGIADDILTCTILSTRAPVVVAPAMDVNMYENPVTQENLGRLKKRGFIIIEPDQGRLASGKIGKGRLPDTAKIIQTIEQVLNIKTSLTGKTVIVTAGGTQEMIDPVRIITNRSSGKMGYAIAEAARNHGAEVVLISAPTALPVPGDLRVVHVKSAAEMKKAVHENMNSIDALIMAAAVSDYQPRKTSRQKIKKTDETLTLNLIKTPDILGETKGNFLKIGFAAESEHLVDNARSKLKAKKLDMIVANDISKDVFGSDTNKVTIIDNDGSMEVLPRMSKREIAERIIEKVAGKLENRKVT